MVAIYIESDTVNLLLEKCTQFLIDYCKNLKSIGTDGVVLAEPAAGLLSNEDCTEFSTKYVKQIVDAVQDENFTVVLHNCGNTGQCTEAMVVSGAKALHFGNKIDMVQTLKECPQDIIVMGNLDPVGVFKQAKAEDVFKETTTLLEQTKEYKNFVISTGCDIPPHVPAENIDAFFAALKEYNN
jgi:uroporphyrinogen decarboxylase